MFVDENQVYWDVKTLVKWTLDGKNIYNEQEIIRYIKNQLTLRDENLIINVSYLEVHETRHLVDQLVKILTKNELQRLVVVHTKQPEVSLSTDKLLSMKGH